MTTTYQNLPEKKAKAPKVTINQKTTCIPRDNNTIIGIFLSFIFFLLAAVFILHSITRYSSIYFELDEETHAMAMNIINDTQAVLDAVRERSVHISNRNKQITTEYLNSLREVLRERAEHSLKKLNQLVLDKVQDVEIQLSVFDKTILNMVNGNLDICQKNIARLKTKLSSTSSENSTSVDLLNDAIKEVENEILQLNSDLDQMFSYYCGYINDIIYHRVENVTNRMRTILVADRKLLRGVAWKRINFCYNILRQNYDVSDTLETLLGVINLLNNTTHTVNTISSTFVSSENEGKHPLIVKSKHVLGETLNTTKELFYSTMNADENFVGTLLKELAYKEHIRMKDYVCKSYEMAIRNFVPAVQKATRDFKVVKDSLWQQIIKVVDPALADLGTALETKAPFIRDLVSRNIIIQNSQFESVHKLMADRFKNASTTVNSLFETKQDYMIKNLSEILDFITSEQLPLISSWSLQNYIPSDACPVSVDYQTYLKGAMDQYTTQSTNLQIKYDLLESALELDGKFDNYISDVSSEEAEKLGNENKIKTISNETDRDNNGTKTIDGIINLITSIWSEIFRSA